jgi:hypothetical protein
VAYGESCIASTRRRLSIATFSGSRSLASNFFHVSRVNLSSLHEAERLAVLTAGIVAGD